MLLAIEPTSWPFKSTLFQTLHFPASSLLITYRAGKSFANTDAADVPAHCDHAYSDYLAIVTLLAGPKVHI